VTLLKDELALEGLWGLASAKDENEYRRKAFEFAKAEREKGNSHERHAFNLSGVRHNLAFTSALLHSLAYDPDRGANSKPLPYEREARELLADISGDGGGFLNVLATAWSPMDYQICRLQQKIKKTSLSDDKVNCELRKVSLRDWSDEEARLAELQLAGVAGSYLFFRGALEGARLGGYVGFRGMYRALKKEHGGRWWQPVKSWRKGREEVIDTLMYSEAEYIGHVGGITRSYLMNFDRFFLALNKQADGGSKWAGFFSRFFSGAKHVVLGSAALGTVIEAAPNSSSRVGQAYNRRLDLSPWPDGKD
jgi:hypothetical protein